MGFVPYGLSEHFHQAFCFAGLRSPQADAGIPPGSVSAMIDAGRIGDEAQPVRGFCYFLSALHVPGRARAKDGIRDTIQERIRAFALRNLR